MPNYQFEIKQCETYPRCRVGLDIAVELVGAVKCSELDILLDLLFSAVYHGSGRWLLLRPSGLFPERVQYPRRFL